MGLLQKEYKALEAIREKLINKTATSNEMHEFLRLLDKSGNQKEVSKYVSGIGFNSMNEFKEHLNNKAENENLITGLAVIGGAVLFAWLLTR